MTIPTLETSSVVFFGLSILLIFILLLMSFYVAHWLMGRPDSFCPYTGAPLRKGADLSYFAVENVLRFLFEHHQYDNRMFDLREAAVCRDTGRIFPNALTWYGIIRVDWSFLQKRYPGEWVSWGSLTDAQKELIILSHHSLEGYQLEFSSPTPSPRLIEKKYVFLQPGPLYVDLETKILLGWKAVPRTNLEVLILQKPKGIFEPPKR